MKIIKFILNSFDGVVVITSALHAEGREFDPRSKYFFLAFIKIFKQVINPIFKELELVKIGSIGQKSIE
jgi:hypothetical protein